jgi:rubrerythrin
VSDNKRLLDALEANWQAEMEGHYTYSTLAKKRQIPIGAMLCRIWRLQRSIMPICGLGAFGNSEKRSLSMPETCPGVADSLTNWVGGADLALRRLEIDEGRDIAKYGKQLKELGDQPSIAILQEVIADEREHYQTLGNLIRSRGALPTSARTGSRGTR